MRLALRIALGLAVLFAAATLALALALPRIARSPAVRERIEAAAVGALGRAVYYEDVSFGLFPPRLVVVRPEVEGASPSDPRLARAERVALVVELAPLLARTLVVDSLVVEGATLELVRTAEGLALPAPGGDDAPAPEDAGEPGPGFALALRRIEIRDSRAVLVDRAVSPAVTWTLEDVNAEARGSAPDAPIEIEASARLASGGRLRAAGTASLDGTLDLELHFEAISLEPAVAYLESASQLGGRVSGRVKAIGPAASPTQIAVELTVTDCVAQLEDVALEGRVAARAELSGELAALRGAFELDATEARVRYGALLTKPAGVAATVTGRIEPQPDGSLGIDDVRLKVRNLDAEGNLRTGERLRARLDAPAFDVDGWGALVPALASYAPRGSIRLDAFTVATAPLELGGTIHIDGLELALGEARGLAVRGAVIGAGDGVRTRDLVVSVGGEPIRVSASVERLGAAPRYTAQVDVRDAELNHLVSALTSYRDTVFGPLTFGGSLRGTLGGDASALDAARGRFRLDVGRGRVSGVSLLERTFERFGAGGAEANVAIEALQRLGGRKLRRFYDDEFESVGATIELAGGIASTDDLRIVYRHHSIDLRGTLRLSDCQLDLTGEITVGEEIDAELTSSAPGLGASGRRGRKQVIPSARVTGDCLDPRVVVPTATLARFAARYAFGHTGRVTDLIDGAFGERPGRDLLEGIFEGRGNR